MHIVYKTTNKLNGKYYIGMQNTDDHTYLGSGLALVKAIKKYGRENFTKQILVRCNSKEEAAQKEYEILTEEILLDPLCYNLKPGGLGGSLKGTKRPKRTQKYIQKQSDAKKGSKNPRHYAEWITPWGTFDSLNLAAEACSEYITGIAIKLFCTSNNSKVINNLSVARSKGFLKPDHVGYTYKELGFGVNIKNEK